MDENLKDRLTIDENKLILDGEPIIEVPDKNSQTSSIHIARIGKSRQVYLGTGTCCDGFVATGAIADEGREYRKGEKGTFHQTYSFPFNVYDTIPVIMNEKSKHTGYLGILATGSGCSGAGVRVITGPSYEREITDIVSTNHYEDLRKTEFDITSVLPKLRIEENEIYLDFHTILTEKDFTKVGDDSPKTLSHMPGLSKDITSWLIMGGVDVAKTIEHNKGSIEIRRYA